MAGLGPGSPVTYNGLRRGEVVMVDSDPKDPTRSLVVIAVDPAQPLRRNMDVTIETAPLTGISGVSMRGRALRSDSDLAAMAAPERAKALEAQAVIPPLPPQAKSREEAFAQSPQMLSDMAQSQDLLASARTIMGQLSTLVENINRVVADGQGPLMRSLTNLDKLTAALGDNAGEIDVTLKNMSGFSKTLNSDDSKRLVKDAADAATRIKALADTIDKAVAGFTGQGNEGVFAELNKAAQSFRKLSDNLDARTAELTSTVNGFAGRTSRELQGLAEEGRRTLSEVDRTLRSLEKNPQRVIWGGSNVPEYNRR